MSEKNNSQNSNLKSLHLPENFETCQKVGKTHSFWLDLQQGLNRKKLKKKVGYGRQNLPKSHGYYSQEVNIVKLSTKGVLKSIPHSMTLLDNDPIHHDL